MRVVGYLSLLALAITPAAVLGIGCPEGFTGVACYPRNCCGLAIQCSSGSIASPPFSVLDGQVCFDGQSIPNDDPRCSNVVCSLGMQAGTGYQAKPVPKYISTVCGDGFCEQGEDCSTCPQDCGSCSQVQTAANCEFDPKRNDNVMVYWGQNSIGAVNSVESKWEQDLGNYCTDSTYDFINIAFLNVFYDSRNPNSWPGLNFANHCDGLYPGSFTFLNCPSIGADIAKCQAAGKKLSISLGGAAGTYGFKSDSQAQDYAVLLWKMFFGGKDSTIPRPFGDNVVLDAVDLDIEGGSATGYAAFVVKLRSLMDTDTSRKYYITGAPQCPLPDFFLGPATGKALATGVFDFVQVQFYNNYCGTNNFNNANSWNFKDWAAWSATQPNKPKILIGVPGSKTAAGTGYVDVATLKNIVTTTKAAYPDAFGGIMIWDTSQAAQNIQSDGKNFAQAMAAFMKSDRVCDTTKPTTSPTPVPTPYCGDGVCSSGESCSTCSVDCGSCPVVTPVCGNGKCETGETCSNCSKDCGTCPVCGNDKCEAGENCVNCCYDCGACPVTSPTPTPSPTAAPTTAPTTMPSPTRAPTATPSPTPTSSNSACPASGIACSPKDCCPSFALCTSTSKGVQQACAPGTVCYKGEIIHANDARCAGVTC